MLRSKRPTDRHVYAEIDHATRATKSRIFMVCIDAALKHLQ